jgi:hypothetical protein
MENQLSKQERRELKHEMHTAKMASFSRRQRLSSWIWTATFIIVLAALFAYIMWDIFRPLAGTKVEILERNHVKEGEKPTYNSNPPTSGDHYADTEEWGISDTPLVVEKLVHNLEHGGIVIYYNCEKCDDLIVTLKDLTNRLAAKDRKIILTPNKNSDAKIALAAWGYYDTMNDLDENRVWSFFNDHINRGPERTF